MRGWYFIDRARFSTRVCQDLGAWTFLFKIGARGSISRDWCFFTRHGFHEGVWCTFSESVLDIFEVTDIDLLLPGQIVLGQLFSLQKYIWSLIASLYLMCFYFGILGVEKVTFASEYFCGSESKRSFDREGSEGDIFTAHDKTAVFEGARFVINFHVLLSL